MQVTINLTPVLVTFIICVFMYAMCKMARKDEEQEKEQENQENEVQEFTSNRNNIHVVSNGQEGKGR